MCELEASERWVALAATLFMGKVDKAMRGNNRP